MAKISSVQKNKKRQALVARYSKKRLDLKSRLSRKNLSLEERYGLIIKLSKLPRDSSKIRVRNRCNLTGRPRGVYRHFGLCRNMLREYAAKGLLPGVIKSSW